MGMIKDFYFSFTFRDFHYIQHIYNSNIYYILHVCQYVSFSHLYTNAFNIFSYSFWFNEHLLFTIKSYKKLCQSHLIKQNKLEMAIKFEYRFGGEKM